MYFGERNRLCSVKTLTIEFPFLQDGLNIRAAHGIVARDAVVATAIGAERTTERNVYVNGRTASHALGFVQRACDALYPTIYGRICTPVKNRRVARITRLLLIIFF